MWGAVPDERVGLSFTIAAGPRQRRHSRVRVPWDSRPYFTLSDSIFLFSSPRTSHRAEVEIFEPASTRECPFFFFFFSSVPEVGSGRTVCRSPPWRILFLRFRCNCPLLYPLPRRRLQYFLCCDYWDLRYQATEVPLLSALHGFYWFHILMFWANRHIIVRLSEAVP
jgi:hypothetical protein